MTALFAAAVFGGSAVGPSVLASQTGETAHGHRATLTFTKWITVNPGAPYMQGIVTGDGIVNAPGPFNFAGQVLIYNQSGIIPNLGPSVPVNNRGQLGDVTQLAAVYEVQSGDHSFRALVQGGDDNTTKHALLDGVVLGGWLAGETVHVQFRDIQCSPVRPEAAGNTCFQGTIAITPGPDR
ncbi:MAG: hypothetical protein JOZ81_34310 [Chloroflexi bacterium]|nr:hypothetical protein [Chloroflexota bacterium]